MAHLGFGDPIKQYPGQVQVTRAVKVLAPGKHFNGWRERECVLGSNRSRLVAAGGEAALAQPPGGSGREPESERRVQ